MPAITYYGPEEGWEELRAELDRQGAEVTPLAEYALDPSTAAEFIMTTVAALGIEHSVEAIVRRIKSRFKEAEIDVDQWLVLQCAAGCEYELQIPVDQFGQDPAQFPRCPEGHSMMIVGVHKT